MTPDSDASTDGEAGEGDDVEEAEVIEGGRAHDTIVTPATSTSGYRLIGNAQDDLLVTGAGKDRLIGGTGEDLLHAGGGADVVEALDNEVDEVLDCGTGGKDHLFGDFREARQTGCEIRHAPQLVGTVALAAVPAGRAVRMRLSWRHPRSWRRLRSVALVVRDGDRVLGRLTVRPREGRVSATHASGTRLTRRGRTVSARFRLRRGAVNAGPLRARIVATDITGRRQAENRTITNHRSSR